MNGSSARGHGGPTCRPSKAGGASGWQVQITVHQARRRRVATDAGGLGLRVRTKEREARGEMDDVIALHVVPEAPIVEETEAPAAVQGDRVHLASRAMATDTAPHGPEPHRGDGGGNPGLGNHRL